jgi:hypothetical protein
MTASPVRPTAADEHARPGTTPADEHARFATPTGAPTSADVERWLMELDIQPIDRGEREAVHSWDVVLDGRRRRRLRITLIHAADIGLLAWAHYAPPINDSFRKSYRQLLHWNDELPFAKFALGEDERIVLSAELPPDRLDRDRLGEVLARLLTIADERLEESAAWLWPGGRRPADEPEPRPWPLLERYAPATPDEAVT